MSLKISWLERHWVKIAAIGIIVAVVGSIIGISSYIFIQSSTKLHFQVFHAGSLTIPFGSYATIWMASHPEYLIDNEAYGSATAIRQITENGRLADLLGSADYTLIKTMMMEVDMGNGQKYADWYIITSTNSMALAYVEANNPPHLSELKTGTKKWYHVLNGTDVTFGRADPYQDPCGYRTLMVWGLADDYYINNTSNEINGSMFAKDPLVGYGGPGATVVKGKEVDLISSLQAGEIDYLFIYTSVAVQQSLNYLEFDDHLDLSNATLKEFYANCTVHRESPLIPGAKASDITAAPIEYGITIPNNAPHPVQAIAYVEFILQNPQIWIQNGQDPYSTGASFSKYPTNNVALLPSQLQPYCIDNPSP
ncbi:MAG: substrate-binding domain-containing protein [Candidatus Helarchaeota archaeon]